MLGDYEQYEEKKMIKQEEKAAALQAEAASKWATALQNKT